MHMTQNPYYSVHFQLTIIENEIADLLGLNDNVLGVSYTI